jgi:hypothetical protein
MESTHKRSVPVALVLKGRLDFGMRMSLRHYRFPPRRALTPEVCGSGVKLMGPRPAQNRLGSPWKVILKVPEPSWRSTLPVPNARAYAPVPLLTAKV